MKVSSFALVAALAAYEAAAHATFQEFYVNGVSQGGTCARLPLSNSPVQDVTSNDMRCNAGTKPVSSKCAVKAGDTVTVEMHQQGNDAGDCASEAIGGAHYGPVNVYMTKVSDASTADGSTGWFHIFADSWRSAANGSSTSDNDYWGTKDLNSCCGKMDLKIPSDIVAGDYLLRAEALALHAASSAGGAQFYMTCFQITVSGGGSNSPATVNFPGAYKATDPGILVNIHYPALSNYVNPGPAVISSGYTRQAGSACGTVTPAGSGSNSGSGGSGSGSSSSSKPAPTTTARPTTTLSTSTKPTTSASGGSGGCTVAKYGQCGGTGFNGCTTCASGSTCTASSQYYSQCL